MAHARQREITDCEVLQAIGGAVRILRMAAPGIDAALHRYGEWSEEFEGFLGDIEEALAIIAHGRGAQHEQ